MKGDKYIIEIAETHTHYNDNGEAYKVHRVKGFNSLFLDNYALAKLEKLNNDTFFNDDELRAIRIKSYVQYFKDVFEIQNDLFDRLLSQTIAKILEREKNEH